MAVCRHFFDFHGCRFANQCRYEHPVLPSPWVISTTDKHLPSASVYSLSPHFVAFLAFFEYPHYFQLSAVSGTEISDLFARFNANEWSVVLRKCAVLFNHPPFKPRWLHLEPVCLKIIEILSRHKPKQLWIWKRILCQLYEQTILRMPTVIASIIHKDDNHEAAQQMFSIYVRDYLQVRKIPMLSVMYRTQHGDNYVTYKPATRVLHWKLEINPKLFTGLIPYQDLMTFLTNCSDLVCLRRNSKMSGLLLSERHQVLSELIIDYVWQDFYCQLILNAINAVCRQHGIDSPFDDMMFILGQYVLIEDIYFDRHGFERSSGSQMIRNIKNKQKLAKWISDDTQYAFIQDEQERAFWKQYLLNHRCTTLMYTDCRDTF